MRPRSLRRRRSKLGCGRQAAVGATKALILGRTARGSSPPRDRTRRRQPSTRGIIRKPNRKIGPLTGRAALAALLLSGLFGLLAEMWPEEMAGLMLLAVFLGVVVALFAGAAWLGHRLGRGERRRRK
jgi:hypothetical protein